MTAVTLSPDLPRLFLEHAGALERAGREGIRQLSRFAAPTGGLFQRSARQVQIALMADRLVRHLQRQTDDMTGEAIWFRGMQATIEGGAVLAENNDELLALLDTAQQTTRELRDVVLTARPLLIKASRSDYLRNRRSAVVQRLATVLAEVFAAVEGARWAVLEREADDDIAAGRVSPAFTNAEDLIAHLNAA